jgi:hypothetical protein
VCVVIQSVRLEIITNIVPRDNNGASSSEVSRAAHISQFV